MSKSNYAQLLKNPEWQKKRLEILQRDEFTCQCCMDSESTLHVHHGYYRYGRNPWEYENSSLTTLCESCHETETASLKNEQALLIEALAIIGFNASHFNDLAVAIYEAQSYGTLELSNGVVKSYFTSALGWAIGDKEFRGMMQDGYSKWLATKNRKVAS